MKIKIFTLVSLGILSSFCSKNQSQQSQTPKSVTETPKPTPTPIGTNNNAVSTFFVNYLTKNDGKLFSESSALEISNIQSERQKIWQQWKTANSEASNEKLIFDEPLLNRKQASWALPPEGGASTTMPFFYGTKGTKPSEGYPLYLYLHGSGDRDREWNGAVSMCNNFNDSPSGYFIPQIPNIGEYYRWWQKSKQVAWEKMLRLAFLSENINPNKIYFFGISEGGYGSQRLASFYADYLAGAGPMAGGEPLINAPVENCQNIAFSLRTGAQDFMFHRDKLSLYTKHRFEQLANENPEKFIHWIDIISGRGHGIDYAPTTSWLRSYVRNAQPKHIRWEDFPMDNIHRKGFYNLFVLKRPETGNRIYYEMKIVNNDISLQISQVTYTATEISPNWGFPMAYSKTYSEVQGGKLLVYLSEKLVDLNQKVRIIVNGKEVFNAIPTLDQKHLVNSCATFFDPERLFPTAVEVSY